MVLRSIFVSKSYSCSTYEAHLLLLSVTLLQIGIWGKSSIWNCWLIKRNDKPCWLSEILITTDFQFCWLLNLYWQGNSLHFGDVTDNWKQSTSLRPLWVVKKFVLRWKGRHTGNNSRGVVDLFWPQSSRALSKGCLWFWNPCWILYNLDNIIYVNPKWNLSSVVA